MIKKIMADELLSDFLVLVLHDMERHRLCVRSVPVRIMDIPGKHYRHAVLRSLINQPVVILLLQISLEIIYLVKLNLGVKIILENFYELLEKLLGLVVPAELQKIRERRRYARGPYVYSLAVLEQLLERKTRLVIKMLVVKVRKIVEVKYIFPSALVHGVEYYMVVLFPYSLSLVILLS